MGATWVKINWFDDAVVSAAEIVDKPDTLAPVEETLNTFDEPSDAADDAAKVADDEDVIEGTGAAVFPGDC